MVRFLFAALCATTMFSMTALAGGHLKQIPAAPDPDAHYLFYMHGSLLEGSPDGTPHPRSGTPYNWGGIVKGFVAQDFFVFSEIRPAGTRPPAYAQGITSQVQQLLTAGVAPEKITVAGHSKGGAITMVAAAMIGNPRINFVSMAGCGAYDRFAGQFNRFVRRRGADMTGRFLSLYDSDDPIAGSCQAIKDTGAKIEFTEIVLRTGGGHQLFYEAKSVWMDEVGHFAKAAK